MLDISAPI